MCALCSNACIVFQCMPMCSNVCIMCNSLCAYLNANLCNDALCILCKYVQVQGGPVQNKICRTGRTCMTNITAECDRWYSTQAGPRLSIFVLLRTISIKQLTNWVQAVQWTRLGAGQTSAHDAKHCSTDYHTHCSSEWKCLGDCIAVQRYLPACSTAWLRLCPTFPPRSSHLELASLQIRASNKKAFKLIV